MPVIIRAGPRPSPGFFLALLLSYRIGLIPFLSQLFEDESKQGDIYLWVNAQAFLVSFVTLSLVGLLPGSGQRSRHPVSIRWKHCDTNRRLARLQTPSSDEEGEVTRSDTGVVRRSYRQALFMPVEYVELRCEALG